MTRQLITDAEFSAALGGFDHTAFHLELQHVYDVSEENESFARWLGGDRTDPTTYDSGFARWIARIEHTTGLGKRWKRVRVVDSPPTPYQQWERWSGLWQARAGEDIRYLTRDRAQEIGLLPAAGHDDWWLLDSNRLLVTRYDRDGNSLGDELITEPAAVVQAATWRDLALHHADVPDEVRNAA